MAPTKLTNRAIRAFVYTGDGKSRDVRWDSASPGFGVRIYPTNRKAFLLSYRVKGRKRMIVIGNHGADLTLDQARERARKLRVQVRDGADPLEERRRGAQGRTFGDLLDAYLDRHARPRKKTWKQDESRLTAHVPAAWRSHDAASVTRVDVSSLHTRIGRHTPYEANRLLSLLKIIFRLGENWGFVDEGFPNPTTGIEKFPERKRKRWLKPEELPPLAQAIDREPSVYVRSALWLYLLTGLRKTELLEARWEDVDESRGVLRLPDTKSGEEQSATLNGAALAILQSVPRLEGNPYILPGVKPGRHLVNIEKPWRRIRAAAGVGDVRLHDLRRTVGSWL